jgi:hypothetical protein
MEGINLGSLNFAMNGGRGGMDPNFFRGRFHLFHPFFA